MARARDFELGAADKSYFYWRGGLSILFGIVVLVWPGLTALTLVTFISLWLLLVGVISIINGITGIKKGGWGWVGSIALGVLELGVGAYLIQRPGVTLLTIVSLLGLVFIVQGLVHLGTTFLEKGATAGHRMVSLLFAVLSLVAGVWVWRYPLHGSLAFVWLLGLYALASGGMLIAMGSEVND